MSSQTPDKPMSPQASSSTPKTDGDLGQLQTQTEQWKIKQATEDNNAEKQHITVSPGSDVLPIQQSFFSYNSPFVPRHATRRADGGWELRGTDGSILIFGPHGGVTHSTTSAAASVAPEETAKGNEPSSNPE